MHQQLHSILSLPTSPSSPCFPMSQKILLIQSFLSLPSPRSFLQLQLPLTSQTIPEPLKNPSFLKARLLLKILKILTLPWPLSFQMLRSFLLSLKRL